MCRILLLAIIALVSNGALAAPLTVGTRLAPQTFSDQHGQTAVLDESVRVLMFSRDMTANKLAKAAFLSKPADYLAAGGAMYVIDVSGMPRFVTNNFAIPKMQKYGYRIFLDRDGKATPDLPAQKAQVTVVHLDHLVVKQIDYAVTAGALNAAVETKAP